jgi:hypothetical protein
MVEVKVTIDRIDVKISGILDNRRGLHAALASRLVDVLQQHFIKKNALPNKMQAKKTDFWKSISQATQVLSVSEANAVVTVADRRFGIHVTGGTIRPVQKKYLTIPLIPEARGLFAASYEQATGRELFIVKGTLCEKTDNGIRAVYALKKQVTIPKDPEALPSPEAIASALTEEAEDWLTRNLPE